MDVSVMIIQRKAKTSRLLSRVIDFFHHYIHDAMLQPKKRDDFVSTAIGNNHTELNKN